MTITERINARNPVQITERMSPFLRRITEARLRQDRSAIKDMTGYVEGAFVPAGSERGA